MSVKDLEARVASLESHLGLRFDSGAGVHVGRDQEVSEPAADSSDDDDE